jgi:hypothetical protein
MLVDELSGRVESSNGSPGFRDKDLPENRPLITTVLASLL